VSGYAAFLRGVNLGAQRKASSAQLRSLFEGLGFGNVATFRTSGNVVFDAGRESQSNLTKRIESTLAAELGFEVVVFLRTAAEVRTLASHRPFAPRVVEASRGKLQVALLSRKPAAAVRKRALALATDEDRLAFGDRELYWLPSGGTRDSALNMRAIDGLLAPMTMRTKGTIEELAAKYFA
jgi:uncharacterized protein (DUF1697 family)